MKAAAKAVPVHASISAAVLSQPADHHNTTAPSRTARSPPKLPLYHDIPVGSNFFSDKPSIDFSKMDDWNQDQTKQFDAAQALFPCTEDHSASGSSYSVYDFIKAAVDFLSPNYTEKQKTLISETIGAHFEHFLVDLAGPAPCKWEEARASFALKDAVAQFVKVYAKAVHAKTRSSKRGSVKKTYEEAMGLIELDVDVPTSQPVMLSPLSIVSTYTPSRDSFKFSSPTIPTPSTPPTPLSAVPSIDFGSTARPLQFDSPPGAAKAPRLGRHHPRTGSVQGLLLFQDIPEFPTAQAQHDIQENAASELRKQVEAKMQEVRSLELQLQLLESHCARLDARIHRLDASAVCATSITSTGALFNLAFFEKTPSEQSAVLDSHIKQLTLSIDMTQLLQDLKTTQLALLEQDANVTKHYRSVRKATWDTLQLRAMSLKAQFCYDRSYEASVTQGKGVPSFGKRVTMLSFHATTKAVARPRKIDEETSDSIFRSICMEGPAQPGVSITPPSDGWSDAKYQHGDREASPEIRASIETQDNISEVAEQNDVQVMESNYNTHKRHDSPYNESFPPISQYPELEYKASEQKETLASSWSTWPLPTYSLDTTESDDAMEETGYKENTPVQNDPRPIILVADHEASTPSLTLDEPLAGWDSPNTPSFDFTADPDIAAPPAPKVIDSAHVRPVPKFLHETNDSDDSGKPMAGTATTQSPFIKSHGPSAMEARLSPIASEKSLKRLSKVSELAKMFEMTKE